MLTANFNGMLAAIEEAALADEQLLAPEEVGIAWVSARSRLSAGVPSFP
jgi:hypothetical protein